MVPKKRDSRITRAMPTDGAARFQQLLDGPREIQHYRLRLYVTGTTVRSNQAVANIRSICDEYLDGHYDLEVVDIYQQPALAVSQQIIAAPTLIKERPVPLKRMVGDLSDRDKVLTGLAITKP